jgi:hypothetical protein
MSNKQASVDLAIDELQGSSVTSNKQASVDFVSDLPSVLDVHDLGSDVRDDASRSPSPPVPYTLHDWDVDMTRGMGHLLQEPRLSVSVPRSPNTVLLLLNL